MNLEEDILNRFKDYDIKYTCGAIIGEAFLVDCILVDSIFIDELRKTDPIVYERSNHVEKYAWKLGNIVKYDKPIYCKGQLGLWNYDMEKDII